MQHFISYFTEGGFPPLVSRLRQTRRDLAMFWIGLRRRLLHGQIGTLLRVDQIALNAAREICLAINPQAPSGEQPVVLAAAFAECDAAWDSVTDADGTRPPSRPWWSWRRASGNGCAIEALPPNVRGSLAPLRLPGSCNPAFDWHR